MRRKLLDTLVSACQGAVSAGVRQKIIEDRRVGLAIDNALVECFDFGYDSAFLALKRYFKLSAEEEGNK